MALSASEKTDLIRDLHRADPTCRLNPDETAIEAQALPFYPGGQLVCAVKNFSRAAPLWYVRLKDETVALDGTAANIHHLNARAPLKLDKTTMFAYLRFRLYFGSKIWLETAEAAEGENTWKARLQDHGGVYTTLLRISPKGEITETRKEKIPGGGRPLPAFRLVP